MIRPRERVRLRGDQTRTNEQAFFNPLEKREERHYGGLKMEK
jgi:hypothetical protein